MCTHLVLMLMTKEADDTIKISNPSLIMGASNSYTICSAREKKRVRINVIVQFSCVSIVMEMTTLLVKRHDIWYIFMEITDVRGKVI